MGADSLKPGEAVTVQQDLAGVGDAQLVAMIAFFHEAMQSAVAARDKGEHVALMVAVAVEAPGGCRMESRLVGCHRYLAEMSADMARLLKATAKKGGRG